MQETALWAFTKDIYTKDAFTKDKWLLHINLCCYAITFFYLVDKEI